jgi:hypothetical protein
MQMVHINSLTNEVGSAEFWGLVTVLEVNLYDDQDCSLVVSIVLYV